MGLRELIAKFTTDVDTKPLKQTDGLLDKLAKKSGAVGDAFKRLRGAIGGAAIVGGVIAFARDFVAEAEQLQYTSDHLRTTTHDLQVMGAVGRSVGLDLGGTVQIMGALRAKVDEATRGLGDGGYTFRRLGVQVRDSNRQTRPLVEILGDTAKAISGVSRESRRLILTDRLLGTEGRRIVSLYQQGGDALREYAELLDESGGGVTQEAIDAGLRLSRAWNRSGLSVDSLRSRIAIFLLPKLEEFVRITGRIISYINKTSFVTNNLKGALAAMTAYGVFAIGRLVFSLNPLALRFALATAAILVTALAVDDLIALFSGGKSVIGTTIDSIFGVGAAAEVVDYVKARFDDFLYAVRIVTTAVGEFWDSLMPPQNRTVQGTATRTPIRRVGAAGLGSYTTAPAVVRTGATLPGAGLAPGRPVALPSLRGTPGGLPSGLAPLFAPAPGGARRTGPQTVQVDSRPAFHLTLQNPQGNGADIAREAEPRFRRMMRDGDRGTVNALRESGLLNNRPETE